MSAITCTGLDPCFKCGLCLESVRTVEALMPIIPLMFRAFGKNAAGAARIQLVLQTLAAALANAWEQSPEAVHALLDRALVESSIAIAPGG